MALPLIGAAVGRFATSPAAFMGYAVIATYLAMQAFTVMPLRGELARKSDLYDRLVAEKNILIENARAKAESELAAIQAELVRRAEEAEVERERTRRATATLEAARREVALLKERADNYSIQLEAARVNADDACKSEPVPDAYADGLRDAYDAVFFGGYEGGSFDFDNPLGPSPDDVGDSPPG